MTLEPNDFEGKIAFSATFVSETEAIGRMPIQAGILNPFGTIPAGAMIWFADVVATTLALQGQTPTPRVTGFPLAINLSANLLSNTQSGELRAVARYIKKGKQVSTVRTEMVLDLGNALPDMTTTHVAA